MPLAYNYIHLLALVLISFQNSMTSGVITDTVSWVRHQHWDEVAGSRRCSNGLRLGAEQQMSPTYANRDCTNLETARRTSDL